MSTWFWNMYTGRAERATETNRPDPWNSTHPSRAAAEQRHAEDCRAEEGL